MSYCTHEGDKYGVEQVSGKSHPGLAHGHKQIRKVVKCGILRKYLGREHKQLIQRLQGGVHSIYHRKEHDHGHKQQKQIEEKISCHRTIGLSALDQFLVIYLSLLNLYIFCLFAHIRFLLFSTYFGLPCYIGSSSGTESSQWLTHIPSQIWSNRSQTSVSQ